MSFQPVLSACVLKDLGASLYIDTDRVLRSTGADVPAGLAGLTDCEELRSANGVDFAVRRRDGAVVWCFRTTISTYLYQEFRSGDVLDSVVLGLVEEAEAADLSEAGSSGCSLTLRDRNGRVFWILADRTATAPRVYAHERLSASGALIRGVSVGAGMYVGSDGGLVYLSEQYVGGRWIASGTLIDAGYQSVSGLAHGTWDRRIAITSSGAISLRRTSTTEITTSTGGWWLSSYTALVVRSYGGMRDVPGTIPSFLSGAILQSGGKRYVASFWFQSVFDISSYVIEAPTAVALWEYGYIAADGAVFWNTPKGGVYGTGVPSFFGPLSTNWSPRSVMSPGANEAPSLSGQALVAASLQNKIDDLVCYFTAGVASFDVALQSMLTIGVGLIGSGGLAVRWDPAYGNFVQLDAAFAATGGLSATLNLVATPAIAASFSGVAECVVALQVERGAVAAFRAESQVLAVLGDVSVLRDGVTLTLGCVFSAQMDVGRVYPDGVVKLMRKVNPDGVSVEPYNDVTLRGARYTNARWVLSSTGGENQIPMGLNWGSSSEGLRFWGTPQQSGEMTAIFEGPYPDGFLSNFTDAGQQSGGQVGCADLAAEGSFVVDRYQVKFIVEDVPLVTDGNGGVGSSDYSLGEVIAELLANPNAGQRAWRGAWAAQRSLQARVGTDAISSSNLTAWFAGLGDSDAYVAGDRVPLFYRAGGGLVQAGDLTPDDMAAADWRFNVAPVMARGGSGVLRTAGSKVQSIAAETVFSHADYVGEALDGVRRTCAFQAEIPLLPGVCWGEFYLRSGFSGHVQVLFYTTDQGAVTNSLVAQLGLKFFYGVQESAASPYRSARTGLGYDLVSGSEQICRATVPLEGRHGVYRLHVPEGVAPGAMANLSIIVKGDI